MTFGGRCGADGDGEGLDGNSVRGERCQRVALRDRAGIVDEQQQHEAIADVLEQPAWRAARTHRRVVDRRARRHRAGERVGIGRVQRRLSQVLKTALNPMESPKSR